MSSQTTTPTDREAPSTRASALLDCLEVFALVPGQLDSERLSAHGLTPRPLSIGLDSVTLNVFGTGKSFAHTAASVTLIGW